MAENATPIVAEMAIAKQIPKMTPAPDPKQGKMDQPGKKPVPNTSNSAPVVEKSTSASVSNPRGSV